MKPDDIFVNRGTTRSWFAWDKNVTHSRWTSSNRPGSVLWDRRISNWPRNVFVSAWVSQLWTLLSSCYFCWWLQMDIFKQDGFSSRPTFYLSSAPPTQRKGNETVASLFYLQLCDGGRYFYLTNSAYVALETKLRQEIQNHNLSMRYTLNEGVPLPGQRCFTLYENSDHRVCV